VKLLYGTTWIVEDEPCMGLYEINEQSPNSRGFHRYQIIYVMRGDKPAQYRKDMGLAKNFKANQLRVPGGARDDITGKFHIEHTVGELRTIADQRRGISLFDKRELFQINNIKEYERWIKK